MESESLVGRGGEIDALTLALEQGRTAIVEGPTGIGKTRLVEECLAGSRQERFEVAVGRCYPFGDAGSYAAFAELVRHIAAQDSSFDGFFRHTLESDLGEPGPAWLAHDVHGHRAVLLRRLAAAILTAATSSPLVLFIDDIQWADGSTLLLLNMLSDAGVTVVCTLRTDEPVEAEAQVLLNRLRDKSVVVALEGLAEAEAVELLTNLAGPGKLSTGECHSLATFTGGNPLFLRELLLHLDGVGLLGRHRAAEALQRCRVPDHLAAAVDLRLGGLEPEVLLTLKAAAVAGDTCSSSLIGHARGIAEEVALDHLNNGVSLRLLVPLDDVAGTRFRFAHPFLAMRLYETMPAAEKRLLHGSIANAGTAGLVSLKVYEIARHTALGLGASSGSQTIKICRAAAEESEHLLAYETAARFWELALLGVQPSSPPDAVADLHRRLGWALWAAGKWPQACRAWQEAALRYRAQSNRERLGEVALALADASRWQQDLPETERWAKTAQKLLTNSAPAQARAVTLLGSVAALQNDKTGAAELLARARGLWLHAGLDPSVTWWLSHGFVMVGDLSAAHEVASQGLEVAVSRGHSNTALLLASGLIMSQLSRLNLDAAGRYLQIGKRATEITDTAARMTFLAGEAFLLGCVGDWRAVVDVCEQSMAEARLAGPYHVATDRMIRANALLALGDATTAREEIERSLPDTETMRPAAAVYLARALLRLGRQEEALRIVDDYSDEILTNERLAASRAILGEVASALDAPFLWRRCYESLHRETREMVMVYSATSVQRIMGRLATKLKDWSGAIRHFQLAEARLAGGGALWELALSYLDGVEMRLTRRRRGDLVKAQALQLRAKAIFDQLGVEYALEQLVWQGANCFALTGRELEVLELVAEGRRNREIAERLTLSLRTVEYHVKTILGKMGANSRAEAAFLAAQAGLVGDRSGTPTQSPNPPLHDPESLPAFAPR